MLRFIMLALLMLCAACTTLPDLAPPMPSSIYKLGTGDRLRITVFGEPALTGEFALDGGGAIAYPLLGNVVAGDKSTLELGNEITARLGEAYVRNPRVSVEVLNYRPVYVLGEVARPGEFPFVEGLSAFALIAKAGGFTYRANRKVLFVRHEKDTAEKAYALTGSLAIRPGDTVRVGERYF
ncbi:MAG: polysaccharide biosynthesis/export family protein [Sphingomonadaceae bacterium]